MTLFLLMMTVLAAAIDARTQTIPNWLTGSLLLVGSIYCLMVGKSTYLFVSITVLLLFLPFHIGGGDKKLIMAMPLYLYEETIIFLGLFGCGYLVYYFYSKKQECRKKQPLGSMILLAVIVTIVYSQYATM